MSRLQKTFDRAVKSHVSGQRSAARSAYTDLVERNPNFANAWHMLGMLAFEDGDNAKALECVQKAVSIDDSNAHFMANLGLVLRGVGKLAESELAFRRANHLAPQNADTLCNLGLVLVEQGRSEEAKPFLERSVALNGKNNITFNTLGIAKEYTGEFVEAERCYRRAIEIDPNDSNAFANLGVVLTRLGRFEESLQYHQRAVELAPGSFKIWTNHACALLSLGRLDEALACDRRSLELSPQNGKIWNNIGSVLKDMGRLDEAQDAYRKSLELEPEATTHSNLLLCMIYDATLSPIEIVAEHRLWGHLYGKTAAEIPPHANLHDPQRRLRIGYLSPDFRTHAVARFIEPILARHDQEQFEIFCYANVMAPDVTTARLQSHVPNWRTIHQLDDEAVVAMIRNDQIDILIDLSGHTAMNRMKVFGFKPAPIQITWIGYPTTTGLATMDYRITDEWLNPSTELSLDTEKLLRLPVGSACFVPDQGAPEVGELPALKNGYVTFGSPHNRAKLNEQVFAVWAKLLHAVPNSKLLLFRKGLEGDAAKAIQASFEEKGIAPHRLDIRNTSCVSHGYQGYMATYSEIDICLDTFPSNAGTTACESVWMGVPFVAIYGDRFFSRQTSCLLHRLGLSEWSTKDKEDYVACAIGWSHRLPELAELRHVLRPRFRESPLGNPELYTRGLEDTFRQVWQKWCRGE